MTTPRRRPLTDAPFNASLTAPDCRPTPLGALDSIITAINEVRRLIVENKVAGLVVARRLYQIVAALSEAKAGLTEEDHERIRKDSNVLWSEELAPFRVGRVRGAPETHIVCYSETLCGEEADFTVSDLSLLQPDRVCEVCTTEFATRVFDPNTPLADPSDDDPPASDGVQKDEAT
jgi:hypothetical protein